jgi:hypothetical protein
MIVSDFSAPKSGGVGAPAFPQGLEKNHEFYAHNGFNEGVEFL